jgi:hypothetical protein
MTLLAELARLLRRMDPMPPRVLADAEAAGALVPTRFDELLVTLLDTVPAVRAAGRRLRLGRLGGEAVLEVEIRDLGPALRLAGLAPPTARLAVRHATGTADVPVDTAGYFTTEVPTGPVRLQLTDPAGRTCATAWFT